MIGKLKLMDLTLLFSMRRMEGVGGKFEPENLWSLRTIAPFCWLGISLVSSIWGHVGAVGPCRES